MKTEQLMYFLDLAQSGSMNKTADNFYTSHQVVRNAVLALENELKAALIVTTPQGTQLTAAGEIVRRYAQMVMSSLRDMAEELAPWQPPEQPEEAAVLQLGVTPYLSDGLLLNFVETYQKRHPNLRIELICMPYPELLQYVQPGAICLMQVSEAEGSDEELKQRLAAQKVQALVIASRSLFLCVESRSKWAAQSFVTRKELDELPLILKYTAAASSWDKRHQQFVNSAEAQKELIRRRAGAGLMTRAEFAFYFKSEAGFKLLEVDLPPIEYLCLLPKGENQTIGPQTADFIRACQDIF